MSGGGDDRGEPAGGRDPHARGVPDQARAVRREERDVVRRVPRRRKGLEVEHPVPHDLHVLGRDGQERAPETVEVLAVQAAGAALEPLRLDQVRRTDLADVHDEAGVLPDEAARSPCMVEVDVREDEMTQVPDLEPVLRQAGAERLQAARGPAVHQRGLGARVEVRGDDTLATEMLEVEELHSRDATRR